MVLRAGEESSNIAFPVCSEMIRLFVDSHSIIQTPSLLLALDRRGMVWAPGSTGIVYAALRLRRVVYYVLQIIVEGRTEGSSIVCGVYGVYRIGYT